MPSPTQRRYTETTTPPRKNRNQTFAAVGIAAVLIAGGVGTAFAVGNPASSDAEAAGASATATIVCPAVEPALAGVEIPASAQAEVDRNLALLNKQIDEANTRLVTSKGQGGANFVQNAILGPLASKRTATLDRIAIAIDRQGTRPEGLNALATCALSTDAAAADAGTEAAAGGAAAEAVAADTTVVCPAVEDVLAAAEIPAAAKSDVTKGLAQLQKQIDHANDQLKDSAGDGVDAVKTSVLSPLADKRLATIDHIASAIDRRGERPEGLGVTVACALSTDAAAADAAAADAAAADAAAADAAAASGAAAADPAAAATTAASTTAAATTTAAAAAGTIECPAVEPALADVEIPASAQAEVDRNLALLKTQINEANTRLVTSAGEGGANFVQNAILGPLADKRVATLNRIETAIGRQGVRPEGLEKLATCELAT